MMFNSFNERTFSPPQLSFENALDGTETIIVSEQFEDAGRIYERQVQKTLPLSDKFKGIRVSDFFMQNVIAAGAVSNLSDCYLRGTNFSDFDKSVSRANDFLDNNPVVNPSNSQQND